LSWKNSSYGRRAGTIGRSGAIDVELGRTRLDGGAQRVVCQMAKRMVLWRPAWPNTADGVQVDAGVDHETGRKPPAGGRALRSPRC
jgi:hypothetical protein